MNIAVFGGAFNPPTVGHETVVKKLLELDEIDEVMIVPSYTHMYGKDMVDFHHRIEMCERAFGDMDNVNVYSIERSISQSTLYYGDGSTYELMEYLNDVNCDNGCRDNYYFVVGMDNAETIDCWREPEYLKNECSFIVLPRGGYQSSQDWYKHEPHIFIKDMPEITASSTAVRNAMQGIVEYTDRSDPEPKDSLNEVLATMLNPSVRNYISTCGFYVTY